MFLVFSLITVKAETTINLQNQKELSYVLAKVGEETITVNDLIDFAKKSPTFYPFLQIPGGPDKLLKELILRKLLVLEGHALGIPQPHDVSDELYLLKVKRKLLPELPPLTEKELKNYYKTHLKEFSTPLMLRISQIKVLVKDDNEAEALSRLKKAQDELKKGAAFELVAKKYSEDPITSAKDGDVGFIKIDEVKDDDLRTTLEKLKVGQVSGIIRTGNAYSILKVTDRRDPIVDPYESVKELVKRNAERARKKAQVEELRNKLEKKWHVVYMSD